MMRSPNVSAAKRTHTVAILMYYTRTRSLHSALSWYCSRESRTTPHYVIGRTGQVVQLTNTDAVAWHAGKSYYRGHTQLNTCAVAIALENLGPLTLRDGLYVSAAQQIVVPADEVFAGRHAINRKCPYEHWHAYTELQLANAARLVGALRRRYGQLPVVGHAGVAPRRAYGPGPALDEWLASVTAESTSSDVVQAAPASIVPASLDAP